MEQYQVTLNAAGLGPGAGTAITLLIGPYIVVNTPEVAGYVTVPLLALASAKLIVPKFASSDNAPIKGRSTIHSAQLPIRLVPEGGENENGLACIDFVKFMYVTVPCVGLAATSMNATSSPTDMGKFDSWKDGPGNHSHQAKQDIC